jgi:Flp pilus assembly protein TadG
VIRNRTRRRPGMTIVETALIIGVLLLFLFGILEYGRFVMTRQVLENAAREGARFAVVNTTQGVTTANVQDRVDQMLAGQSVQLTGYSKATSIEVFKADPVTLQPLDANNNPVASWTLAPFTNAQFGQGVAVRITGTYTPVLPSFLYMGHAIPLQATCLMYSEAN